MKMSKCCSCPLKKWLANFKRSLTHIFTTHLFKDPWTSYIQWPECAFHHEWRNLFLPNLSNGIDAEISYYILLMKYNNLSTTDLKLRASFMTYLKPLTKFHKKCFIHDLKQNSNLINGCKWFTLDMGNRWRRGFSWFDSQPALFL